MRRNDRCRYDIIGGLIILFSCVQRWPNYIVSALAVGPTVTSISAGGGLPVPYKADDDFLSDENLGEYFLRWNEARQTLTKAFGHPVVRLRAIAFARFRRVIYSY
eukprot:SAG31_NODE_4687_length_3031_cov_1.632674_6_plen_105_part_00